MIIEKGARKFGFSSQWTDLVYRRMLTFPKIYKMQYTLAALIEPSFLLIRNRDIWN
jgi:hypothetical protein